MYQTLDKFSCPYIIYNI